jgi:hypothetical protein
LLRRFHETNVLIDFDERYAARMAGTRQDWRLGLQRLAFSQAGYVTAAQARNLGYSYQAQKYQVDSGNWLRVDRGLFRLPDWPPAPEDQWVRWTLWSNGRGVVSHDSAALVHDLGELDPRRVHLSVPVEFRAVDPAVVTHPTELLTKDVLDHGAWRVTTPLRTLLDLARRHHAGAGHRRRRSRPRTGADDRPTDPHPFRRGRRPGRAPDRAGARVSGQALVANDRVEIFLNAWMKDQAAICHFQRAPIRASNSSQVNPMDGSA